MVAASVKAEVAAVSSPSTVTFCTSMASYWMR